MTTMDPNTNNIPEQIIPLQAHIIPDVKRIAILVAHHSQLLQGLENELCTLIRVGHGVDLKNDPEWRVDVEHGALLHTPNQTTTPSPDTGEHNEQHGQSE